MRYALVVFVLLVTSPLIAADKYTIRKNRWAGGPSDRSERGLVVERSSKHSSTIRREAYPNAGYSNKFERGTVVTKNPDGSYTARKEFLPGSGQPDTRDPGYTIEVD